MCLFIQQAFIGPSHNNPITFSFHSFHHKENWTILVYSGKGGFVIFKKKKDQVQFHQIQLNF